MSVVKVIPRANAILFMYPDGGSKTFLLSSYLTASAVGNNISVITSANEYALYKFPYTAVRDSTNTVFSGTAAGTVTALNNLFGLTETDVDQLKVDFDDLNGRALDDTSLITDLLGVEKFTTTKSDYLLVAGGTTNGEVKTKAPATFISENSIVVNSSSPNFVEVSANTYYLGTASNGIVYEGTTVDNFETTIKAINPTADRTINFPDASGTVALVGTIGDTTNLDDLADIVITDPLDHDSLIYDEGTGDWINGAPKSLDMPVHNGSGAIISKGALCKAIGTQGDKVSVGLFDLDVDDPKVLVGLATAQLAISGTGHVRTYGELRGITTDTYPIGTILYASGTPGVLSSTAGSPELAIAIVTRSQQNTGRLFIRSWTPNSGKAFRYVTAGGNTLEAEKQEDTLTLTAAGGMTITSVTGTDTITLDSARLDDDDVTLTDDRVIDLNDFSLTIYNGASVVAGFGLNVQTIYGDVRLNTNNGTPGKISFYESTTGGSTNYVSLSAPASLSANTNYILPAADGSSGQVLSTNGSGTLSWATASGGGGTPAGNTGEIQFNNGGSFGASSGFFWDNTNGRLGVGLNTGLTNEITASVADVNGIASFNTAASSATAGSNITVYSNDNAALISGDRLGGFNFGGSTGVGTIGTGASIQAFSAGTYAPASIPSVMTFSTVPGAASTLAERMRIFNDGNIAIGDTSTLAKLSIRGTGSTSGSSSLIIRNSGAATLFQVRDDGKCVIGTGGVDSFIMLNIRGATSTSSGSTLRLWNSNSITTFQVRDDGAFTFFGGSLGLAQTGYTTFSNLTTLRTGDADTLTLGQLSDIVGTLILDLKIKGIIAS